MGLLETLKNVPSHNIVCIEQIVNVQSLSARKGRRIIEGLGGGRECRRGMRRADEKTGSDRRLVVLSELLVANVV
jgi:hypothetical protein